MGERFDWRRLVECGLAGMALALPTSVFAQDPVEIGRVGEVVPASIRAFVGDRDQTQDQDYIGVFIDPVGDGRRAFNFQVSAAGVQTDALYDPRGGGSDPLRRELREGGAPVLDASRGFFLKLGTGRRRDGA